MSWIVRSGFFVFPWIIFTIVEGYEGQNVEKGYLRRRETIIIYHKLLEVLHRSLESLLTNAIVWILDLLTPLIPRLGEGCT
ncbi:MAG: hypothetical protein APF81_04290 [Desulfosporosinus sp. BRH_c37]|nr:MAG: hypothetical protein APF81_04290 [Desulfosporosinus sp. BRH_c37]